jgi:hypothetical protein
VFAGAKPPLYWPSVYVIEGLGQSCNLLNLIWKLERIFAAKGLEPESICRTLMNLDANDGDYAISHSRGENRSVPQGGADKMSAPPPVTEALQDYATDLLLEFVEGSAMKTFSSMGLLAAVDVEVIGRVCAGELLRYEVRRSHVFGELSRFTVRAYVGERVVVRGAIVGARLEGAA